MKKQLHCQNCGTKIKSNSNFCEGCGERLEEEEDNDSGDYEEEIIPFSKKYPDYVKRFLEISIFLNIALALYSIYINWGYFYWPITSFNVATAVFLSLFNILFLVGLYIGNNISLYGLGITVIVSFLLLLSGHILVGLFAMSLLEFIIFYYIIFWLKHPIK